MRACEFLICLHMQFALSWHTCRNRACVIDCLSRLTHKFPRDKMGIILSSSKLQPSIAVANDITKEPDSKKRTVLNCDVIAHLRSHLQRSLKLQTLIIENFYSMVPQLAKISNKIRWRLTIQFRNSQNRNSLCLFRAKAYIKSNKVLYFLPLLICHLVHEFLLNLIIT